MGGILEKAKVSSGAWVYHLRAVQSSLEMIWPSLFNLSLPNHLHKKTLEEPFDRNQ